MFEEDDWNIPPTVKSRVNKVPGAARREVHSEYIAQPRIAQAYTSNCSPAKHCDGNTTNTTKLRNGGAYETSVSQDSEGFHDGSGRLFSQLLDDVDDISNRSSAFQRRRASRLFTSWLFNPDSRWFGGSSSPKHQDTSPPVVLRRDAASVQRVRGAEQLTRRFTADFTSYDVFDGDVATELTCAEKPLFSRDEIARHSVDERIKRCKQESLRRKSDGNISINRPSPSRCLPHATSEVSAEGAFNIGLFHRSPSRRRLLIDTPRARALFNRDESLAEDDADSGYHTGNSNVLGAVCRQKLPSSSADAQSSSSARTEPCKREPSQHTLTRDELTRRIEAFNRSSHISHGLLIDKPLEDNTFRGAVRVHMNLIRPINMCTSVKPPSLYDLSSNETVHADIQITSFYLPQNTTTVIHIASGTTVPEVIRILLSKFSITDNPRKFALYEKSQEQGKSSTMRRMSDDETPLPELLSWADAGIHKLESNKFVLQENDAGEIMWDDFSLPELDNFLGVLNREEEEYIDQVKTKYRVLRIQIQKRLSEKRSPVFV